VEAVDGLARWLVVQAAALHAPRDLSIVVLATTGTWGWVRWLPHAGAAGGPSVALDPDRVDELARSLARGAGGGGITGPWTLVLVDREAAGRPAVASLLEAGPGSRTTTVVLARDAREVPSGSGAVITVDGEDGLLSGGGAEGGPKPFRAEVLSDREALESARAMAPLTELGSRPPAGAGGLGLLDLLGIDDASGAPVEALWRVRRTGS
jgi:S-DNA-T family DNA segregation ATPase FtsK/SpoIIIE